MRTERNANIPHVRRNDRTIRITAQRGETGLNRLFLYQYGAKPLSLISDSMHNRRRTRLAASIVENAVRILAEAPSVTRRISARPSL